MGGDEHLEHLPFPALHLGQDHRGCRCCLSQGPACKTHREDLMLPIHFGLAKRLRPSRISMLAK